MNEFEKQGYLIIRNFFAKEKIKDINSIIKKRIEQSVFKNVIYEKDDKTIRSIMGFHNEDKKLHQFIKDPILLELVEDIVKSRLYISQTKINLKQPFGSGKKWEYHRGFTFWNLLDGIKSNNLISVFVFLSDQTKENGAVHALEESHKGFDQEKIISETKITNLNLRNHTSENLSFKIKKNKLNEYKKVYDKVVFEGSAGDIVLMHSCLLHASSGNKSNKTRGLMIPVFNSIDNLPTKFNRPAYLCEPYVKLNQ